MCTVYHVKITNCVSDDLLTLYICGSDSTQKSRDNLEKAQNFISLKHFKFCKLLILKYASEIYRPKYCVMLHIWMH